MNKPQLKIFPCYLIGLLIMAVSAWAISLLYSQVTFLSRLHWIVQLLPPLALMIAALIVHPVSKGRTGGYLFSYFLNATASGWAIGVLLGEAAIIPPPQVLAAMVPAAALGLILMLFSRNSSKAWRIATIVTFSVLGLALIGGGIYVWCVHCPLAGCAFVFSGLFYLPLPFCYGKALSNPDEMYRYLSYTGFGAFILIFLVVMFILSEGEILDGLDFDFGGEGGKKKNKPVK
ncbi:MAG: hypothetical protein IJW14_05125 [Oscillospiraceae bacterium]|nr:hypothetical protein [Oscillospiraceae bacterium]